MVLTRTIKSIVPILNWRFHHAALDELIGMIHMEQWPTPAWPTFVGLFYFQEIRANHKFTRFFTKVKKLVCLKKLFLRKQQRKLNADRVRIETNCAKIQNEVDILNCKWNHQPRLPSELTQSERQCLDNARRADFQRNDQFEDLIWFCPNCKPCQVRNR